MAMTLAVLVIGAPPFAVTARVTTAEALAASVGIVQATVVVPLHVAPVDATETKVVPAGSVSLTVTPVAAPGPALETVMV